MSIFFALEILYHIASDSGVRQCYLTSEEADAFSRRLLTLQHCTTLSELSSFPGYFTCVESTSKGELWSCSLTKGHAMYFIPTTMPSNQVLTSVSYPHKPVPNAVIIVGLSTNKGLIGQEALSKPNTYHEFISCISSNSTASGSVFKGKVG